MRRPYAENNKHEGEMKLSDPGVNELQIYRSGTAPVHRCGRGAGSGILFG